jgi:AraC family ethanolamine operon transcriptional activator
MKTATFSDFEEFAASLQHVDARILLTRDRGQRWHTQTAQLNRLTIQYGLEGGDIIFEGVCVPDGITVFVPMKNAAEIILNGQVCSETGWVLQHPGREYCYNVTGPNEWVSVFFPLDVWDTLAIDMNDIPANQVMPTSPELLGRFREIIGRYLAIDHGHSRFLEIPLIQDAIEQELLATVKSMAAVQHGRTSARSGRPPLPRVEVMREAFNLVDGESRYRVSSGALADAAGVSERTLRNIFREFYGVGPLRYMKLRQLHAVRGELKQGTSNRPSVAEAAARIGIKDLSRFAREYRQLFRESPAETLTANGGV